MKLVLVTVAIAFAPSVAHAFGACAGKDHWSPGASDELPPHAHVVYTSDRPDVPKALSARIDGTIVPTKLITYDVKPFHFVLVEIRSDAVGKLELSWRNGKDDNPTGFASATYKVVAKPTYPKIVHGKTDRYYQKFRHSTVRDVHDGLQIAIDVPAVLAHVKIRRDAKALWSEFDVPINEDRTLHLGELGCNNSNYTVALLEQGVDLDVLVTLPDNSQLPIPDVKHATIPKRAPTSNNPWDP